VSTLNIPIIDLALQIQLVAILFSILSITGLANAYNIIDGFNGLASMIGIITLTGLAYVSLRVNDPELMFLSLIMLATVAGFFIWNYPAGLIFLGDGGAYLIGFWIALISILLVNRHQEISPWFAFLINGYPIIETLFTIYRRKIHQNKNPGQPDGMHFHTLLYRRVFKSFKHPNKANGTFSANAKTSPFLWLLSSVSIIPSVIYWQSTPILLSFTLLFCLLYWWLYRQIVYFKTPRWL
jgi:UDP-N-acetylmuramyl pentapeptide phosphotransferase/UDP-N-acetylglucosamine-1-phosphate transferase